MSKLICLLITNSLFLFSLQGQRLTSFHQSIPIAEDISDITVAFSKPFQVETWPNKTVLIETTVQIDKVSKKVLKHLVNSGRYTVKQEDYAGAIKLRLSARLDKPIVSQLGPCEEEILYKVYVPERLQLHTIGAQEVVSN